MTFADIIEYCLEVVLSQVRLYVEFRWFLKLFFRRFLLAMIITVKCLIFVFESAVEHALHIGLHRGRCTTRFAIALILTT